MILRDALYALYARRLRRQLTGARLPEHVALVIDGNRRWARQAGLDNPSLGHKAGAEHIEHVLAWSADLGIRHVTIFVASLDNLRKRGAEEVLFLMDMVEQVVTERLVYGRSRWQVQVAGRLDALPDSTAEALKRAVDVTAERDTDCQLTIAIGYDGRAEIADAFRSLLDEAARDGRTLEDLAQTITPEDLAAHLYTSGQPDPDLVIRTSGERRMSSFLLWQAARSELYFCDVYWPGFRYVDYLRALRSYAARSR